MRYQILIPHIPHRHAKLLDLLDVLEPQMQPGVEVLIYADNLEASYVEKLQTLQDAATADYTSISRTMILSPPTSSRGS